MDKLVFWLSLLVAVLGGGTLGALWSTLGGTHLYHEPAHALAAHAVLHNCTTRVYLSAGFTEFEWDNTSALTAFGASLGAQRARAFIAIAGSIPQWILRLACLTLGPALVACPWLAAKMAGLFLVAATSVEWIVRDLVYVTSAAVMTDDALWSAVTATFDFPGSNGTLVFNARNDFICWAMNTDASSPARVARWTAALVWVVPPLWLAGSSLATWGTSRAIAREESSRQIP